MKVRNLVLILASVLLLSSISAVSDIAVFQGQYFIGEEFQTGTYEFDFDIYDAEVFGNLINSETQTLTTGTWGQWRTELSGISTACNDTTKDYFVEITIDGNTQSPRRRLTHFNYLRKDTDDSTTGDLTISNILNFLSGGFIQELADRFFVNKNLEVSGSINASGNIYSDNKLVCLEDGTNCAIQSFNDTTRSDAEILSVASIYNDTAWVVSQNYLTSYIETDPTLWSASFNATGDGRWSGGTDTNCSVGGSCPLITYDSELSYTVNTNAATICLTDQVLLGNGTCVSSSGFGGGGGGSTQYVSFISTIDGKLKKQERYLPLGTDSAIAKEVSEASWIIDRALTITGFLWNSKSNDRDDVSEIIIMKSTGSKGSFSETSLSADIQGQTIGSASGSVSFSQGNLIAIKYDSSGSNKDEIEDLSVTLIGTYN